MLFKKQDIWWYIKITLSKALLIPLAIAILIGNGMTGLATSLLPIPSPTTAIPIPNPTTIIPRQTVIYTPLETIPSISISKISITGAAFGLPASLKDDVAVYKQGINTEFPSNSFLLVTEDKLYLVFANTAIDKGLATVVGTEIIRKFNWKGEELSVIIAENVSIKLDGEPATISEILSNPINYRLKLVKIDTTLRQTSILWDPDDGSDIEFPITTGIIVDSPKSSSNFIRDLPNKAKELRKNPSKETVDRTVGDIVEPHIKIFSFDENYWIDSGAEVNGIIIYPEGGFAKLLKNLDNDVEKLIYREGEPSLYVVKFALKDITPALSIEEIRSNPDRYMEKIVSLEAFGYGQSISIQESMYSSTGQKYPVDALLYGVVAWNEINMKKEDFLGVISISSQHQDTVTSPVEGRFNYVGKIVSSKQINESLPEGLILILYKLEKVGGFKYEDIAEDSKKAIEERSLQLNTYLRGEEITPPYIPPIARTLSIIPPDRPTKIEFEKGDVTALTIRAKNLMSNVNITIQKLDRKPPEITVDPPGKTYSFLEIEAKNLTYPDIENITIEFKVNRTWVIEANADEKSIELHKYINGNWIVLNTHITRETSTEIYYSAESPSFSTYAITAIEKGNNINSTPSFEVLQVIIGLLIVVFLRRLRRFPVKEYRN
jgi:PGF-pre-PGF domain-containing protein